MRSLSRKTDYRKSTLRNLTTSLILFERITTTEAKAKELKSVAEHLINSARPGDVNGRRKLLAYLFDENAVNKTIDVLMPRYENVPTGFIHSYKTARRKGDAAEMMILELRPEVKKEVSKEKTEDKKEIVAEDKKEVEGKSNAKRKSNK